MATLFSEEVPSTQIPNVLTNRQPKQFLMDSIIDPSVIPIDQSLKLTPTAYVQNPMVFEPMKSAQQPSIVGGLFNPELRSAAEMDYLQKRQDAMKNEAMAFAQLTPAQQAQFGFYRGGQQLGEAIGGALGGQDPQLKLIAQRQAIGSQIDYSDPESIRRGANLAAKIGDQDLAMKLLDVGNKLEGITSQTELRKAQAEKARNWQQTQTDSAQKRAAISSLEATLASDPSYQPSAPEIASARWIVANESKTRTQIDPTTGQLYVIEGLNIEQAAPNLAKLLQVTGTTKTTTGAGEVAPGVKAVETPASIQKTAEFEKEKAQKAAEEANQIDSLRELKTRTGEVRKTIADTKNLISGYSTGYGSILSILPMTDARTLENNLESIKADLAFAQLQALKDASKTGASGLGQTTKNEFDALQSRIKKLDPKSANFAKDLDAIDAVYARLENQLETKAGRAAEVSTAGKIPPKPSQTNPNTEAIIQKFIDFNGGKPTRQQAIDFLKKNGKL